MLKIIQLFIDIVLFKKGPQDVPDSSALMSGVIIANILLSVAFMLQQTTLADALGRILCSLVVLYLLVRLTLRFKQLSYRLRQTFTALLGAEILLSLVQISVAMLIGIAAEPAQISPLQMMVWLPVVIWVIAVNGNIMHYALDVKRSLGVMLALAYLFIVFRVTTAIFGFGGEEAATQISNEPDTIQQDVR